MINIRILLIVVQFIIGLTLYAQELLLIDKSNFEDELFEEVEIYQVPEVLPPPEVLPLCADTDEDATTMEEESGDDIDILSDVLQRDTLQGTESNMEDQLQSDNIPVQDVGTDMDILGTITTTGTSITIIDKGTESNMEDQLQSDNIPVQDMGTDTDILGTITTTGISSLCTTTTSSLRVKEPGSPSITGLFLMSTAYTLDERRRLGLNADFFIAYYIGNIYADIEEYNDFFIPIRYLFLSGDIKYRLLREHKFSPAIAGGYQQYLVLTGNASTPAQMGGKVETESTQNYGYSYGLISKQIKGIGIHGGFLSGQMGYLFNPLIPEESFEGLSINATSGICVGVDLKINSRRFKIECIYPQITSENKGNYFLINTCIERFLGFDFGCIIVPDGFSIVGGFGVRFTMFPPDPSVKK